MGTALDSLVVVYGCHPEFHIMLRVGLADVDHVEVRRTAAKLWMGRIVLTRLAAGYPGDVTIGIGVKLLVVEVDGQLAKLPEMKGDVLARIGYRAVRSHDDFVGFVFTLFFEGVALLIAGPHHPAACQPAFGFELDSTALFQKFERALPDVEVEHVGFAG